MKTRYKINGIFLVLVLNLVLINSSMANAGAGGKYSSSKTLRSMARIYMAYGEYAKAQPLAEQALTLAERNEVSDCELAMCMIDLATLYLHQGKLVDAEEMCQSGMQLQKKALYKNHPYLAYTLRTLSSIYQQQGEYPQAEAALDNAMAIMLDSHNADDKAMAPFYVDIAKLCVVQNALEKAENYYHKAMDLINKSYGPNHLYTANVLADIAKLYAMQGKYTKAEELINQAIAVQEKIYGPDHHLIAPSWLTKAKISQATGSKIRTISQIAYGPIAKADK